MKYIDADKLAKAIEDKGLDCSFVLKMERLDTLALIDELQQEQQEEPDKSLEEAAKQFVGYDMDMDNLRDYEVGIQAFIAGAKWQRQQMLKDAVEGEIHFVGFNNAIFIKEPRAEILDRYNVGNKVRIIIVKED